MGKNSLRDINERLEELIGLLRARDSWTAQDLANELSVSLRTLMRHLDLLKRRGLPIESDRGRGGGIRLHRFWGAGRLNLDYLEAIDLLLSLSVMEKTQSPILLKNLKSIRNKIAVSFSDQQRKLIQSLRKRILVGDPASRQVIETYKTPSAQCMSSIHASFFEMNLLEVVYRNEKGKRTKRTIEPQFLFLNWPVWYILAWDLLKEDVRTFRIDRVESTQIQSTKFRARDEKLFLEIIQELGRSI